MKIPDGDIIQNFLMTAGDPAWFVPAAYALIGASYLAAFLTIVYWIFRRADSRGRWVFYWMGVFFLWSAARHITAVGEGTWGQAPLGNLFVPVESILTVGLFAFIWKWIPDLLRIPVPGRLQEMKRKSQALINETAELRMAQQISDSKEKVLESLLENQSEMAFVLGSGGEVRIARGACGSFLGSDSPSMVGKNFFEWLHPDDAALFRNVIDGKNSAAGEARELQIRLKHKDAWNLFHAKVSDRLEDPVLHGVVVNVCDITGLTQSEEEIKRMAAVASAIGKSEDLHGAVTMAVEGLCRNFGWQYGEVWFPRADGRMLEFGSAWHDTDELLKEFRAVSQELRFPEDMGLAGRVWGSGAPEWIEEINASSGSIVRNSAAHAAGLRAAAALPVIEGGETLAVLVFFACRSQSRNEGRLSLMFAAAAHLGAVMRRKRVERTLREVREQVDKRIRERTEELIKANQDFKTELDELKHAHESLRQSQRKNLTLVNSIEGIVYEYDLRHAKYSFVSEHASKVLGYPVEAWFGEPSFWKDRIHGSDREAALEFRQKAAASSINGQFDYRMISSDGQVHWFRDIVTVVTDEGKAVKIRGVMVDMTDRKQLEDALNQEKEFASAVLDTAGALVLILDTEGRIARFNRACEQVTGYSAQEIRGRSFWESLPDEQEAQRVQAIFARLLAGQFPTQFESTWRAKDGALKIISWTSTVLFRRDGTVAYVVATGIDITTSKEVERKLTEAVSDLGRSNRELDKSSHELKEANQRLKRMDEIKSHFISAASHELRTPLTSIKGYVETILHEEAGPVNRQQKEFLGYVKESTDRLHRLLNELLDISKIESGQVRMNLELINLRELLKEEVMLFKAQADEKEIHFSLEAAEDLRELCCDSDKIREVVDNLVSNAIKYTPRKGRIRVFGSNVQQGVRIDIEDNGIGIKEEDLHRVFEPFQHIEKEGYEDEESTELGLTLAKRIVEAHHGTVHVKSEYGKGSIFTIFLPVNLEINEDNRAHWAVSQEICE